MTLIQPKATWREGGDPQSNKQEEAPVLRKIFCTYLVATRSYNVSMGYEATWRQGSDTCLGN